METELSILHVLIDDVTREVFSTRQMDVCVGSGVGALAGLAGGSEAHRAAVSRLGWEGCGG